MNNTDLFDEDLNPVLCISDQDDLDTLVKYLKTKFSEYLTVSDAYKEYQPDHTKYADLIAKEIRDMGGNSFANALRGFEGPVYHEIVCDVAKKLKVPFNKSKEVDHIENAILEKVLDDALDKMTEQEKEDLLNSLGKKGFSKGGLSSAVFLSIFRAGGFKSYQLTLIIANQIARTVLGHGLKLGTNATIAKTGSILAGPLGIAITAIWTAVDLAGPSYKVTIPCVIHIAMLRKKHNASDCKKCGAILPDTTFKFCPECGGNISS